MFEGDIREWLIYNVSPRHLNSVERRLLISIQFVVCHLSRVVCHAQPPDSRGYLQGPLLVLFPHDKYHDFNILVVFPI